MRLSLFILLIAILSSCGSDNGSKKIKLKTGEVAERPSNVEIDQYALKGFGLMQLDHSQIDFNLYAQPGFANKVIAHLKLDENQKPVSDSLKDVLPIFQNGLTTYFQVTDRQDEFHKIIIDELYGTEVWISPGQARKFISWPVFLMERKNLKPIEGYSFLLEQSLESDSIMNVPENCYKAVQSSAEWLHLMKKEDCTEKDLPKFLYLNWRKNDRRMVDFEF